MVDTFCLTNKPFILTDAEIDALTEANARRMLVYNEYGKKRCGWKV